MTEWVELAAGLSRHLATLPAGAVLIISESEGPRYAQFRQFEDRLYAELVSDAYLDSEARVGEAGARRLVEAGWQLPEGDRGNWWLDCTWPLTSAQYQELAAKVLFGLHEVLGITEPDELVYESWNSEADDQELPLPGLGLRRAQG